jgi:fucose 4-O-acetylase-like acetyltransferase
MRIKTALDNTWPMLLVFAIFLIGGVLGGAHKPANWFDFSLLVVITGFNVLLASLILRRMHGRDWLTIALASVFIAVAVIWCFAAVGMLWTDFSAKYRDAYINPLRIGIIVTHLWATYLLITTADDGRYAAEQRAEGVIEGHLEGVAQEKSDQYDREMAV